MQYLIEWFGFLLAHHIFFFQSQPVLLWPGRIHGLSLIMAVGFLISYCRLSSHIVLYFLVRREIGENTHALTYIYNSTQRVWSDKKKKQHKTKNRKPGLHSGEMHTLPHKLLELKLCLQWTKLSVENPSLIIQYFYESGLLCSACDSAPPLYQNSYSGTHN